jgi:hypothetical protein
VDPYFTSNVVSSNSNVDIYSPIKSFSNYYNGRNFPQNFSEYPNLSQPVDKDNLEFLTPYYDKNSFLNVISSIAIKNEYQKFFPTINTPILDIAEIGYEFEFDIELKLIVDIEFNTLGEDNKPNSVTQILTYKIRPEDITDLIADIFPNLESSSSDITQYPENLTFLDQVFDGSSINGCKLVGNHYTCQAWNDITINGNLTTANGYTVDIFAGNIIEELPESTVSPEIVLDIKPILDYSHPMPQADQTYVSNFCKGLNPNAPSYKGNQPSLKILAQIAAQDSIKSLMQNQTITEKPFDFTLYPNPTSNQTRIAMQNNDPQNTRVSVTDITGKEISVKITNISENTVSLDVQALDHGVYFVTVKTNYQQKTKQLVVN